MVKANAYGLGMEEVVRALDPLTPWGYGVATVAEGVELRHLGVDKPIFVATPIPPGEERFAVDADLTPSVSDVGSLERLRKAAEATGTPIDFHVEIDTGMGRSGFAHEAAAEWGREVARAAGSLRWTGAFTHFHSADEADGERTTREQLARMDAALAALPVERTSLVVHAANSAAAIRWPESGLDLVRPGIFLYGGAVAPQGSAPQPSSVASIRARVSLVREMTAGATAGYGATYIADRAERWATVAIGYGDGLPRALGNTGFALVRGRRVPLRGRVSMDSVVLDVTEVDDVVAGDVATFVGADGDAWLALDEVAARAGTISYEILTRLGNRLERIYEDDGR